MLCCPSAGQSAYKQVRRTTWLDACLRLLSSCVMPAAVNPTQNTYAFGVNQAPAQGGAFNFGGDGDMGGGAAPAFNFQSFNQPQ